MSESSYPLCPICKKEILVPFSSTQFELGSKTFGCWFCSWCGFYLTTRDNRAINPEQDIETGFNIQLRRKIREMKKNHIKSKSE